MRDQLCRRGCGQLLPIDSFPMVHGRRGARCTDCLADQAAMTKHGMTRAQRAGIAEAQGGCLICRRPKPGRKGWVVDHDRSCCPGDKSCEACRRGVLCAWCNTALGYAGDDPQRLRAMAAYLESGRRIRDSHVGVPWDSPQGLGPAIPYETNERTNGDGTTDGRGSHVA